MEHTESEVKCVLRPNVNHSWPFPNCHSYNAFIYDTLIIYV